MFDIKLDKKLQKNHIQGSCFATFFTWNIMWQQNNPLIKTFCVVAKKVKRRFSFENQTNQLLQRFFIGKLTESGFFSKSSNFF
jgi:hypothetical protein